MVKTKRKSRILNYLRDRQKEKKSKWDISSFESDLFNFLKFIYKKGPVDEKTIQKRYFSQRRYNELKSFALKKKYIIKKLTDIPRYDLTHNAKEFLLEFQRTKSNKNNTDVITWATVILAISASVSLIDLLLKNEETRNFIILNLGKAMAGVIQFIIAIFIIILGVFFLGLIIKGIIKIIKKSKVENLKGNK